MLLEKRVNEDGSFPAPPKRIGLSTFNIIAYAVGHVYNDLCATVWFMYLFYFIVTFTQEYGPSLASLALLSGQIADGICTNFVGLLIDKTNSRLGKRTPWFLAGTILVLPWFLLTFRKWTLTDIVCGEDWEKNCEPDTHKILTFLYYITLPALFNVGWAAVQISTMSLVVAITYDQKQRDSLISYRNACTFGSNLLTLTMALYLFEYISDAYEQFKVLTILITIIGLITSGIFILGCPEVKLSERAITHDLKHAQWSVNAEGVNIENWRDWLKSKQFYAYWFVYTLTRLSINVTMTLTPFYLIIVLKYQKRPMEPTPREIASVPLVSYCCSTIFTLLYTHKFGHIFNEQNRVLALTLALIFVGVGSVPFLFIQEEFHWIVYIWVPIQGIGLAIGLNTSASLMSDMIGNNNKSSAFVYGTYSLVDKFASGLLLVFIGETMIENAFWLRCLAGFLPVISIFMALLFWKVGQKNEYEEFRNL